MKYTVKCDKCGKEFKVELFGKNKDREWKLEHFSWKCEECYKAEKEAETAKKSEGLPELTDGTEKQIVWAKKLRIDAIELAKELIDLYDDEPEKIEKLNAVIVKLTTETSAVWFINNRNVKTLDITC